MHANRMHVRFTSKARTATLVVDQSFLQEVERFAAVDPRWRNTLELGAAYLSPRARCTLGVVLSGLEVGRAPGLLPLDFVPDDDDGISREIPHMDDRISGALGIISSLSGTLGRDVVRIHGIVTAVHRLLRIAKTHP